MSLRMDARPDSHAATRDAETPDTATRHTKTSHTETRPTRIGAPA
ncbi:hypothetical protein GCM10010252_25040 [Streptomyces aureoverticillatus]|nr:hypothetical protein GCM10010252_25040 [Streptomyces aureoverticillatus]